ncbi:hypothetical protein [Thermoanaerobacterium thermosaccharolyticum]|uniref:hypothetical protein n=1 Tax=Thermoanaerobacterium thermosaccharolyticum TaxID=1517 RepID=UPI00177FD54B|nr:hypothetical protein [Thermoanaerobacterium thermosaccharolyticum]MBE0069212.1 hypothetical protein [Thermoanaerobacterium thermosaccharolyticum]MBE0228116.1 hypothetical protein [Thermoanaerobacterium thermosaccharolyticum]
MKKKITLTFTDELADTLSYLSTILHKNQNQILEDAFWEWWNKQDKDLRNSIDEMLKITNKVRNKKRNL